MKLDDILGSAERLFDDAVDQVMDFFAGARQRQKDRDFAKFQSLLSRDNRSSGPPQSTHFDKARTEIKRADLLEPGDEFTKDYTGSGIEGVVHYRVMSRAEWVDFRLRVVEIDDEGNVLHPPPIRGEPEGAERWMYFKAQELIELD